MITRFFTPSEIADYFERGELKADLLNDEIMGICSVADFLDICEAYKKGKLRISSHKELNERFDAFDKLPEGPVEKGLVFIVNLDQDKLSSALFERDDGNVVGLWDQAATRHISPKRSLRYLTLRTNDDSAWWGEDVYLEMEAYHASQDG
ncbi:MAG TPA: hypothetical protein ENK58_02005 [Desulfobacterales bacterium]|nr:MAG: hypothetical protein DRI57_26470 [Deltaproteobacteria bacterium]HHC24179.1 hypothetical protein [Desulfobacterales bacterium]